MYDISISDIICTAYFIAFFLVYDSKFKYCMSKASLLMTAAGSKRGDGSHWRWDHQTWLGETVLAPSFGTKDVRPTDSLSPPQS